MAVGVSVHCHVSCQLSPNLTLQQLGTDYLEHVNIRVHPSPRTAANQEARRTSCYSRLAAQGQSTLANSHNTLSLSIGTNPTPKSSQCQWLLARSTHYG